ncbi:hypothetical protein MSAN_00732400 [Mycena sanguinolenta]|uniref:Uncharacterized protein n=1 Tax=Mycena sanguinolenta TaxID=230812 RepID=A0A8H6Z548_9AGAR|nr:hypothetical protein MSAN_00732400 [Mycena sanguinolenta]
MSFHGNKMATHPHPLRRFTQLRSQNPSLTDTQLLNSNNQTAFTGKADVVVAGAGILGLCYAIHLKNISPDLNIQVFEKNLAPIQKIGESTLSPFSTFTTGDMLPYDYLLRLFGLKDGLQWYNVDREGREITAHDLGGLDISFQVDRRLSELFMTMWAQSIGINVYHGVSVDFEVSDGSNMAQDAPFTSPKVILNDSSKSIGNIIDARIVCDASGFSRRLTSKFGPREKFDGWNTDAYWTYFREKDVTNVDDRLIGWNYPATKHLCFPEGWGWFIGLISWERAPLANLMDLVAHVIASAAAGISADEFSCTRELSEMFACPYEFITSIGWAVRNDFILPDDLSSCGGGEAEQKFNFFRKRYPTIDTLLTDNFEHLPGYYGGRSYFVRKGLAYRSPVVAGEGWLAIGNSAGFTNPLISPGINVGIGGAWRAANLTAKVLAALPEEARATMTAVAKTHQAFVHDFVLPRLHNMNQTWYNSFRDHRLFEAVPRTLWSVSYRVVDDHYSRDKRLKFSEADAQWLLGAGLDEFQVVCSEVLEVLDGANGGTPPFGGTGAESTGQFEPDRAGEDAAMAGKSLGEVAQAV